MIDLFFFCLLLIALFEILFYLYIYFLYYYVISNFYFLYLPLHDFGWRYLGFVNGEILGGLQLTHLYIETWCMLNFSEAKHTNLS